MVILVFLIKKLFFFKFANRCSRPIKCLNLYFKIGNFHSFGQLAKETYHNLSNEQASKWLFFDKFKMAVLHRIGDGQELTKHTTIKAANGVQVRIQQNKKQLKKPNLF